MPHVPALDGLRGVAVAGVLLFHLGVGAVSGGFLGVDAFFVLSGFLITSLLLAEVTQRGGISLRAFWRRRARRLLPALLVVLVAVALLTAAVPDYADPVAVRGDGLAALLYVANWRFALSGHGYFDSLGQPSPLLHTWSLGIEEQFYLLWPVVLALVLRRGRRPGRTRLLGFTTLAAALSLVALQHYQPDASRQYYGSDSRAFPVLLGCALALVLSDVTLGRTVPRARARRLAGAAGVVAPVVATWLWATADGQTSLMPLLPVHDLAVAAAIASVVIAPALPLARALCHPLLRRLGEVSYGLYLWHWPVIVLLTGERTGVSGLRLLLERLGVSLLLAVLSRRWVEQPIRRRRIVSRGRAWVPAVAMSAVAAVLLGCSAAAPPEPDAAAGPEATVSTSATAAPVVTTAGGGPSVSGSPVAPRRGRLRVSLFGDSVALTLGRGLATTPGRVQVVPDGQLGCGILTMGPYRYFGSVSKVPQACLDWRASWSGDLRRDRPDVVAVLVGRWEVMDRQLHGHWQHIGEPDFDSTLSAALDDAITTASAAGRPVAMLSAPYYHRGERPDGGSWPEDDPSRVDLYNALLRQVVSRHPGVTVIDLTTGTSADGRHYSRSVHGLRLRYDGVHFTADGARWVGGWLLPQVAALASPPGVSASPKH